MQAYQEQLQLQQLHSPRHTAGLHPCIRLAAGTPAVGSTSLPAAVATKHDPLLVLHLVPRTGIGVNLRLFCAACDILVWDTSGCIIQQAVDVSLTC